MAGTKSFTVAMAEMASEVLIATGMNEQGEQVGNPRFFRFSLTSDIRDKIRSALESFRQNQTIEAIATLEEAGEHLRRKQVAYLRNLVIPALSRLMTESVLPLNLGNRIIDPIYAKIRELEAEAESRVNLDKASELYWTIVKMASKAQADHKADLAERARREADRIRQREAEARIARAEAYWAEADRLAEQYAGLLVA